MSKNNIREEMAKMAQEKAPDIVSKLFSRLTNDINAIIAVYASVTTFKFVKWYLSRRREKRIVRMLDGLLKDEMLIEKKMQLLKKFIDECNSHKEQCNGMKEMYETLEKQKRELEERITTIIFMNQLKTIASISPKEIEEIVNGNVDAALKSIEKIKDNKKRHFLRAVRERFVSAI